MLGQLCNAEKSDEPKQSTTTSSPWAYLQMVSRYIELPLQSDFHLFLMLLVHYQSCISIQPWMESTIYLGGAMPNNPNPNKYLLPVSLLYGPLNLLSTPFQIDIALKQY